MTVRLASKEDAADIRRIYAPIVEQTAISFETRAPSITEIEERIAETLPNYPWLVAVRHSEVIGYAYATEHRKRAAYRWSVDVAVYVSSAARRYGAATALYWALFELLRRQGFAAAYAGISLPNQASVHLHEAFGFRPVGVYRQVGYKAGAWRDVGWWQLDLQPRQPQPSDPVQLACCLQSNDLFSDLARI